MVGFRNVCAFRHTLGAASVSQKPSWMRGSRRGRQPPRREGSPRPPKWGERREPGSNPALFFVDSTAEGNFNLQKTIGRSSRHDGPDRLDSVPWHLLDYLCFQRTNV